MIILCHIVGINKNKIQDFVDRVSINYNVIDLDKINQIILSDDKIIQLYKQYVSFKNLKNDKYKDVDKKMNIFWEKNMISLIEGELSNKKQNIIIGYNNHYRNINKKINIDTSNKFMISHVKQDTKDIIKYNIEKYKDDIINGIYPVENINYDYLIETRKKMEALYIKNNYMIKSLESIYSILELNNTTINDEGLWVASKQPYNMKSKIYPIKNDKIYGFTNKSMALLNSFKLDKTMLENGKPIIYKNNTIKLDIKNNIILDQLKEKRYIYYVDKSTFVPHEKGNNIKYFSQSPVTILEVEKINNVYDIIEQTN